MSAIPVSDSPGGWASHSRRVAWLLLVASWILTILASSLDGGRHQPTLAIVTAFLLWRIWRGASWSRRLLVGLSCISAGVAVGLAIAIAFGATGIVVASLAMFGLYAVVGGLLCAAPVRSLCSAAEPSQEVT
jgi:hypothetical protein